jgi:hypothetical protein
MPPSVAIRFVALAAVVGCHDAPVRHARDCFGYVAPPGWQEQPSKTGADLVIANP